MIRLTSCRKKSSNLEGSTQTLTRTFFYRRATFSIDVVEKFNVVIVQLRQDKSIKYIRITPSRFAIICYWVRCIPWLWCFCSWSCFFFDGMFDLKTRKRELVRELLFAQKSNSGQSQIESNERVSSDRATDELREICIFRDRLRNDLEKTVSFHHHRSTPRNRRTPTFFFFSSQNAIDTKTKRKEVCELRK